MSVSTRSQLPKGQWTFYLPCILKCLSDLDVQGDAVTTGKLKKHFFNNDVKTRQVLGEMLNRNYVVRAEPVYNLHVWKITEKGRQYITRNNTKFYGQEN